MTPLGFWNVAMATFPIETTLLSFAGVVVPSSFVFVISYLIVADISPILLISIVIDGDALSSPSSSLIVRFWSSDAAPSFVSDNGIRRG